ncbi:MAG: hypothetical protein FWC01_07200 [Treponema sp.]|nr:hypothetical protein [Treponema sp.]MCL2237643.1 hypothetical protein [Treponema sp.]
MKFKYLIIAFAITVIVIILIITLVPVALSGPGGLSVIDNFRMLILPLLSIMVLILICLSIFFFINYRLLSLLEREDWPALAYYLEQKIFVKKRYKNRNVRLLASSYLVISDYLSVLKLESKAAIAKPAVVSKNVLIFGAARILSGNHGEAIAFFKNHLDKTKGRDHQWVRWFHGFSYLLAGDFSSAEPIFMSLAVSSNDAVIAGLSAFFIDTSLAKYSLDSKKCRFTAESARERICKTIKSIEQWTKETERMGTDIHIAIIRKYVEAAGKWLFKLLPPETETIEDELFERRKGDRRQTSRRKEERNSVDRRQNDRRSKGY